MVTDRAFVFHIYIPWGKTLSNVPKSRSSVKVTYQGHSFRKKIAVAGPFVFDKYILFTNINCMESTYNWNTTFPNSAFQKARICIHSKFYQHFLLFLQYFQKAEFPVFLWTANRLMGYFCIFHLD